VPALVGWAATTGFFVATIVVFRAGSLEAVWRIYEGLAHWPAERLPGRNALIVAFLCATLLPPSHDICRRLAEAPRRLVAAALATTMVVVLVVIGGQDKHEFVYFQF